ncbi:hypothetical protein ACKWTF_011100 [Chironomus riparius]
MNSKTVLFISVLVFAIKLCSPSPVAHEDNQQNVDIDIDIACIANSTCLKSASNKVIRALKLRKSIDFGLLSITPLKNEGIEGRSFTKFWDIASTNSLRIPLGQYSLSVQKSEEHENYLEVAVSKTIVEGRARRDRKQMQFFVPSFLVASQVGWWLLALAGVTLLSIKAFLVSKIALVIAAVMTFKKLFLHHHGIPAPYYEHHEPLMVPFNFGDYGAFQGAAGFPGDYHQQLPIGPEHTAALHANGGLGAESGVSNIVSNGTGSSTIVSSAPGLSAYSTVGE